MDFPWLAGVVGFAFAMSATPGPNNTIVAASGAAYGIARSMPLMTGIGLGVAGIMLVVAAFGASLVSDPRVGSLLKWIGIAYLLWLAWKIAMAEPVPQNAVEVTGSKPLSFIQGMLFQIVNPKLWVMVSGAVVTYGQAARGITGYTVAVLFACIFGFMTFISTVGWSALGASVGRLLTSRRSVRCFNVSMAILLVASLVPAIFE
ncbi:LysE family translocator [Alcaligenes faecalis]|uniref:LysE family translocator n=1 Tax=Alcaligenes faecalis TaxID=511 RepID=UPI001C9A5486|nr:LysE family translocator [Alcaligenes faecalis]MBY6315795.1 LysE family translocator [Alcaligenes faecalis]MBY6390998.1 LysE family translocator [Alcaligenes faecalis]